MDRDYLIGEYFKLGLKYSEIIKCLEELHGYIIGIRTLKRITKKFGLIPYQDTSSAPTNGIRAFSHAFHIVLVQIMLSVEYHSYISGGKVQISYSSWIAPYYRSGRY
jgi:hypothetical protein